MGTHLRVLSKGYPINTNMIGFRWLPCALDEGSLSIGRVKDTLKDTNHCEVIFYKGLSRILNITMHNKIYKVIMQ